ncbi:MAG: hydroxyacylglutathione hydrolase [Candidatus Poriferisodalaceae bacterium]|jgi:hydroxyacylglutathione hydrolase
MIFEQHYLECLSQASYLIGDETSGRAVVVDPRRDIGLYVDSASEHGLTIELVIETHFHADFLSGHLELAAATGASIAYGSAATTEFESRKLDDGEVISLGDVALEIRHTPGHTPESISVVVTERPGEIPYAVLTGDTLFIGDVGRPDLLSSVGVSSKELAECLYDSLHSQLMTLPDATRVYPAHGAGSACGKNLSTDTWSTIGEQRATNYALNTADKASFVEVVTEGQTAPPAYFSYDAGLNRAVHQMLDEAETPRAVELNEVLALQRTGAVLLDTRDPEEFALGHLIGSVNVGLAGRFSEFTGGVVQPGAPIVLISDDGRELESKNRLARIGFDSVVGYLADRAKVLATAEHVTSSSRLTVTQLDAVRNAVEGLQVIDIRQPGETAGGVIEGAILIPLTQLNQQLHRLDASKASVVYCAGGYRSSIAASKMVAAGFSDVSDLLGGYGAWETAHPLAASR